MKILKNLYIGNTLRALDTESFLACADRGETVRNACVITISTNPANQLDIIHTLFLRQRSLRMRLPLVAGIASDRAEAVCVLEKILQDTMEATGGMDMRSYLLSKEQKELRTDG